MYYLLGYKLIGEDWEHILTPPEEGSKDNNDNKGKAKNKDKENSKDKADIRDSKDKADGKDNKDDKDKLDQTKQRKKIGIFTKGEVFKDLPPHIARQVLPVLLKIFKPKNFAKLGTE